MTTPSDRDSGVDRPGDDDVPGVDLGKSGAPEEAPFDPYRFGKPDRPIPPEYAPPGYVPEQPQPGGTPYGAQPPPAYPPAPPYGSPPGGPPPYGSPPYGSPPGGPSPYGGEPGPYGPQYPPYPSGGYGAAPPPGYSSYPPPAAGNGRATAALVLGIASILLCWLSFINVIFLILALIFGVLGLSDSKRRHGAGRGLAISGLVCAAVGLVATVVFTAVVVHAVNKCGGFDNTDASDFKTCVQNHL